MYLVTWRVHMHRAVSHRVLQYYYEMFRFHGFCVDTGNGTVKSWIYWITRYRLVTLVTCEKKHGILPIGTP